MPEKKRKQKQCGETVTIPALRKKETETVQRNSVLGTATPAQTNRITRATKTRRRASFGCGAVCQKWRFSLFLFRQKKKKEISALSITKQQSKKRNRNSAGKQ